jgi:alanyl-tRNA synthetase
MADRGRIDGRAIADVQEDDGGVVHHLLEADAALPPVDAQVRGEIDAKRRRAHMALHTAQHMLSRALLDEAAAATVSARLGETQCTIDLDVPSITERLVARAEDLVNDVVDDDRTVRAFFPTPEELDKLSLRRAPKVSANVRVVEVAGFDVSPCGGTHCDSTAQVGLVKVLGLERYKGKIRLFFTAGPRARADLARSRDAIDRLSRTLTCGSADVETAVEKLRQELADERAVAKLRLGELARLRADALVRGSEQDPIIAQLERASVEELRRVAGCIVDRGRIAVLAGGGDGGMTPLVVSAPAVGDFDAGATIKRIAAIGGGRGGGRKEHAEGTLPANADASSVVAAALGKEHDD